MRLAAALLIASLCSSTGLARTWLVEPDGSGDAPTIQAGLDSAEPGDTVLLGDGTFRGAGNREIDFHGKAVVVRSEGGSPEGCRIDCEGLGRGFYFHTSENTSSVLAGVTVMGGLADEGGAVYCGPASPLLTDCVFLSNAATIHGGGLCCAGAASPTVRRCTFTGNDSEAGAGIYCIWYSDPRIRETIVAGNHEGGGLECFDSAPVLSCCDIYANAGGDWIGVIADQCGIDGNFTADPLFCDAAAGDFTLRSDSPCLPGNHPDGADCGVIGALGEGCEGPTAVRGASWGGVKAMFR